MLRGVGCRLLCALGVLVGCELNPAFDPLGGAGEGDGSGGDPTTTTTTEGTPGEPLGDVCPALGPPQGESITVTPAQAAELGGLIAGLPEGHTVLFEPGTYAISNGLWIDTPGLTLRSSTGNPDDVILDGQGTAGVILGVVGANITIAEMTLQRSVQHLIHMSGNGTVPAPGITGYRLNLVDAGASSFKVNPTADQAPADDGLLACSTIRMTDARREELGDACGAVSGVAMFGISGWHIRDNYFEGFWCDTGFAGAAVHASETSADLLIERNVIRDCVIGIHLGIYEDAQPRRTYPRYDASCTGGYYDFFGGTVRNNMIVATGTGIAASDIGQDTGIALWQVCDVTVVHNTVVSAIEPLSSIEYRFGRTKAKVLNNLVTHAILDRDDAGVPVAGNLQGVDLNNFVDPLGGDAHLVPGSEAVDAGVQLGEDAALHDIDGDPRRDAPDIGADEI
jgi:hypothetical protein